MKTIKSHIGFGCYRISNKSKSHKAALLHALNLGCDLIDTSANYTDGESESLIGEALKEQFQFNPTIISKVGYIQGSNIDVFDKLYKNNSNIEYVEVNEHLKHSIDPIFIEKQLNLSLKRLQKDKIDIYLLHNPEYAFHDEDVEESVYLKRIEKALLKLEQLVNDKKIGLYGISSNTFVTSPETQNHTSLEKVIDIVKRNNLIGFKYIQFPFNLIEVGAIEKYYGDKSLIDIAKEHKLITISNRPLNAFSQSGLLRLADDHNAIKYSNESDAHKTFELGKQTLIKIWEEQESEDKLGDFPLFKQICTIWDKQQSVDAVEQVFYGHLFPLIAQIYGRDLSPDESTPYYNWFEQAIWHAKKNMIERAEIFHDQAVASGLIPMGEDALTNKAIQAYLNHGVDHVLVGMRNIQYVEDLKRFFNA